MGCSLAPRTNNEDTAALRLMHAAGDRSFAGKPGVVTSTRVASKRAEQPATEITSLVKEGGPRYVKSGHAPSAQTCHLGLPDWRVNRLAVGARQSLLFSFFAGKRAMG